MNLTHINLTFVTSSFDLDIISLWQRYSLLKIWDDLFKENELKLLVDHIPY